MRTSQCLTGTRYGQRGGTSCSPLGYLGQGADRSGESDEDEEYEGKLIIAASAVALCGSFVQGDAQHTMHGQTSLVEAIRLACELYKCIFGKFQYFTALC